MSVIKLMNLFLKTRIQKFKPVYFLKKGREINPQFKFETFYHLNYSNQKAVSKL